MGGRELADGTVESPRSYCSWHAWCREQRTGGRYRNDFARWLEERRAQEKPWIHLDGGGQRPSHWYRHTELDLWEAVGGLRELPRVPGDMPEHWSDPEPEAARRFVPPAIARWFFGRVYAVYCGELTLADALKQLRQAMAKHGPEDEVIE